MSLPELEAIQSRLDAATPAPWDCDGFADGDVVNLSLYEGTNEGRIIAEGITRYGDADLLRYAQTDVAFLLNLVRKQQAALEAVCKVLSNADAFGEHPAGSDILAAIRSNIGQEERAPHA
jgi:hypothetical protein